MDNTNEARSRPTRHAWSYTKQRYCTRPGCPWRRRYVPHGPAGGLVYEWSRDGETWERKDAAPECEGVQ